MAEIHLNDVGTVFKVRIIDDSTNAALDVSDATTKQIKFKKPDGTVVAQTAVFTTDGSDGYIQYTTVANDLNALSQWHIQGFVSSATYENHSEISTFDVNNNLS